ncbi:MAG: family 16 glycosylhydrolase [Bacteroidota bacterium]
MKKITFFYLIFYGLNSMAQPDPTYKSVWSDDFRTATKTQGDNGTWGFKNFWVIDNNSTANGLPNITTHTNTTFNATDGLVITTRKQEYTDGVFLSSYTSSWSALTHKNSGIPDGSARCFAVNGSNLFCGTNQGVFLTTNSGNSWSDYSFGTTGVSIKAIKALANNSTGSTLFAASEKNVFQSSNSTIGWATFATGLHSNYTINCLYSSGSQVFIGTDKGVYVSTYSLGAWTYWTKITGFTDNTSSIVIIGTDLYAGIIYGSVKKCTGSGTTWTYNSALPTSGLSSSFPYTNCLAVGGTNLLLGCNTGVYKYNSVSGSWSALNSGLTYPYVNAIQVISSTEFFAGTNGGGTFRSTNGGTSWSSFGSGTGNNTTAFASISSNLFQANPGEGLANYHYTTAGATSWGSSSNISDAGGRMIQYGYVEAKIKMMDTYGMWNTFWTWSQDGPCTVADPCDYDEVDIFEMIPGCNQGDPTQQYYNQLNTKNIGTSNMHLCGSPAAGTCNEVGAHFGTTTINDYTQWHTYGLEWTPSRLIWYLDGAVIRTSPNPGWNVSTASGSNITQPTGLILGGGLAPYVHYPVLYDPDALSYITYFDVPSSYAGYNSTSINTAPSTYTIQSVKYYRLDVSGCTSGTTTYANLSSFNGYDLKVKQAININGGGTPIVLNSSSPKGMKASTAITMQSIEVPLGVEILFDVTPCY